MMKKIFLFQLLLFTTFIVEAQIDSIVMYYRAFDANYHFYSQDFNKVKDLSDHKKVITNKCEIDKIQKALNKVKKRDKYIDVGNILLGAYKYMGGNEVPYFYILNFDRLVIHERIYKYEDKFLRILFPEGYNKELKRVIIGGYREHKYHPDDSRYQETK